jgi:hypothetical protein
MVTAALLVGSKSVLSADVPFNALDLSYSSLQSYLFKAFERRWAASTAADC